MKLLFANFMGTGADADSWRNYIHAELPDLEIEFWPDCADPASVDYLAFGRPNFDDLPEFPNLKLMMTRQAGVDAWIKHPKLPDAPLTKLEPAAGDTMMTEYTVMHVLQLHRNMAEYRARQARKEWGAVPQLRPEDRGIGFLGYGMMAKQPAHILKLLGFDVAAWTRTPKPDAEIPIYHGPDQLEAFLARTDIAVCLLPLTPETRGILCARTFAMMPDGAMIVNNGRGEHVVTEDLIAALDSGQLSAAALDAHVPEPLPPESPLWKHPKVTVMPHAARRPPMTQIAPQMIENIRRCEAGEPLIGEVDKQAGY